jgi:hypothetical protein
MNQLGLFKVKSWKNDADEFIERNPEVYAMFRLHASRALARGRRFGMKALAEKIRWDEQVESLTPRRFKVDNGHISWIGRRLIEEMPGLDKLIETRKVGES